jgi:hypothetical protein
MAANSVFTPQFRLSIVERVLKGQSVGVLSQELNITLGDSSYSIANDPGWQSDGEDEASLMSPKPVPPKSGSGSAAAVPDLNDE